MDDFYPENGYNPEDEYESIDDNPADGAAEQYADDDIPVIDPPEQRSYPQDAYDDRAYQQPYDRDDYGYPPEDDYRRSARYDEPQYPDRDYDQRYDRPAMRDSDQRYDRYQPRVRGYVQRYDRYQPPMRDYDRRYDDRPQPPERCNDRRYDDRPQPPERYNDRRYDDRPQTPERYNDRRYDDRPQPPERGYDRRCDDRPQPPERDYDRQDSQLSVRQGQDNGQYPQRANVRPYRPQESVRDNPYEDRTQADSAYDQPVRRPAQNISYPQQKPPVSAGTKAFIIILCALLAAMVVGFIVYISTVAKNAGKKNNSSDNGGITIYDDNDDDDNGYGSYNWTDVEDEITLIEDNGETQKRSDDNPDSVGKPDEKAQNIKLKEPPEDKDDEKYTKQSSYETVCDSVVTVECYKEEITDNEKDIASVGTGTIISKDGYIITNAHVIGNSKVYAVRIITNGNEKYQAKIIGYDTWTDLAVLKIDADDLKPVTFGDSELVNVGDEVITIGSPGGVKFQNSLTQGIVSAVDRELSINRYVRYIQSDAAISPGNSGGPLCNIYGQVIGITTAKSVAEYYENMTFSIPSATVEEVVGDLMRYGYVRGRTRIGFTGTEISQQEIYYYGYPAGVLVNSIDESGALAGTKIKEGDIITEIDGEEVASFQDIYNVLANHKPGDKVKIKAVRPED